MEEEIVNYVLFDDEINKETVSDLVDKLSSYPFKINLWFSTCGGTISPMFYLIDYLNLNKDRITVTVFDEICSAGTLLFAYFDGAIKIDRNLDVVMFHVGDRLAYRFRKEQGFDVKRLDKKTKESNIEFINIIKSKGLLNDKQVKDYLGGKDVYVYSEQFNSWKL